MARVSPSRFFLLSLSFSLFHKLFCVLARIVVPVMPRCTSSSHFCPFENSGTFRTDSPYFSRSIDDRTKIDEHQLAPIRTSWLSPTANLPVTFSQWSAPCPFLETRSLSLPTSCLATSFPPPIQSVFPISLSHLVSPG